MFRLTILVASLALVLALPPKFITLRKPISNGRIIGGQDADIKDYPYQVSLLWEGSHMCGGSIISETYVVTAAYCTDRSVVNELSVRVGSSILGQGGEVINVAKIHQNPKYERFSSDYDISILELARNITLGENAQAIGIIETCSEVPVGTNATVSGWGDLELPSHLQVITIPIVSNDVCNKVYQNFDGVTDRMLCAGLTEGGKDFCTKDIGGPLVTNGVLTGIVSHGYGCAIVGLPGVYSNVAALRHFITEVTGF